MGNDGGDLYVLQKLAESVTSLLSVSFFIPIKHTQKTGKSSQDSAVRQTWEMREYTEIHRIAKYTRKIP